MIKEMIFHCQLFVIHFFMVMLPCHHLMVFIYLNLYDSLVYLTINVFEFNERNLCITDKIIYTAGFSVFLCVYFSTLARGIVEKMRSKKTCLTLLHFCACPKSRASGLCKSYVIFNFCSLICFGVEYHDC